MRDSRLNRDQQKAVEVCAAALEANGWARLEGPAGTGKTFTANSIVSEFQPTKTLGVSTSHVAARVLRGRVPFPVTTIAAAMYRHELDWTAAAEKAKKLLDKAVEKGEVVPDTDEYQRRYKMDVERKMKDAFRLDHYNAPVMALTGDDLLVVDEHSMVKPEVLPYLEQRTVCPILLLGDSFQLPPPGHPVGAFEGIGITHELTQIMRGGGTNIPEIAMRFRRNQARFMDGDYGEFLVRTVSRDFMQVSARQWTYLADTFDVIIAPFHRTRMHVTKSIRRALFQCGVDRPIMQGDRFLVKRRNVYGLEKSMILTVGKELAFPPDDAEPPPPGLLRLDIIDLDLLREFWQYRERHLAMEVPDELPPEPLLFPRSMLEWAYSATSRSHGYDAALATARSEVEFYLEKIGEHMATILEYGWAVTVHSIQGAEYERVAFLYPGWGNSPDGLEARRLVYTAITRAKKKILFLRSERFLFG